MSVLLYAGLAVGGFPVSIVADGSLGIVFFCA